MSKTILCIEDEFFISELYGRVLRKAGYEVTTCLSGEDGLQFAQTNTYDIILLDIMVPGITGIEVLRALRSSDRKPPLKSKVIITTNLDLEESERAEIEKMADGYLIKADITPRELVAFINNIA
jgi:DNA-binding response OmpR family regulator